MGNVARLVGALPQPSARTLDVLLAAAVALADVLVITLRGTEEGVLGVIPPWAAVLVALAMSAPLVVRRDHPTTAMLLTGLLAALAPVFGVPVQALAPLVALYSVGAHAPLADTVVSTVVFFAVVFGMILAQGELLALYYNLLIVLAAAATGRLVRTLREQAVELGLRAQALEWQREEQQALAVRAERSRIAREMHDILAHSTSVMVVQATGARRVVHRDPATAEQALAVIEATGRETLAEMRRMLGVLRDDDEEQAPTRPQPTLADLPGLVAEFMDAGLPVELRGEAAPDLADASVGLAAYRIVQEALTNVLKHADASRVVVEVRRRGDRLHVEVLDDGGGVPPTVLSGAGGGYGLVGMRERAAMAGGSLEAAPRPTGGFRVVAEMPLQVATEPGSVAG